MHRCAGRVEQAGGVTQGVVRGHAEGAADVVAPDFIVGRGTGEGGDPEVELAIEGLPAGIKTELGKLAAAAGETTLKITATDKAPITNATFTVVGTATFNDRNYKTRTGPISLVISAPEPVEIATNAPPAAATSPAATK